VSLLEAIVLGIVQGLTEFLPISSTAHLRIVPAFAGWEDPGAAFTAVTQLGTLAAVLLYFRRDLLGIARAWLAGLRDPNRRATPSRGSAGTSSSARSRSSSSASCSTTRSRPEPEASG
jgi:undecaprenyl-diphosphatase